MIKHNRFALLLFLAIVFCIASSDGAIWARGGGGRVGGGDRFGGDRFGGDFHSGFDGNRDHSYYGDRADVANSDRDVHPAETRNYSYGDAHPIASDGGFGRLAGGGAYGRPITNRVSAEDLDRRGINVRNNYCYAGCFNHGFWGAHPEAGWAYANRWHDNWAWGYSSFSTLAGFWGMSAATMPVDYAYGNNITYQNDNVYYGSQPTGTTAAYYNEAQTLAQSVPITAEETKEESNWKPLGVFSMVQGDQQNTTTMFQLAVNKNGAIKGTYYNPLTSETKPVTGAVDKKKSRASWIIAGDKTVVYDTGLYNLLQKQSQMLVHYGKDKTQQWTLVRLEQPKVG